MRLLRLLLDDLISSLNSLGYGSGSSSCSGSGSTLISCNFNIIKLRFEHCELCKALIYNNQSSLAKDDLYFIPFGNVDEGFIDDGNHLDTQEAFDFKDCKYTYFDTEQGKDSRNGLNDTNQSIMSYNDGKMKVFNKEISDPNLNK